MSTEPAEAIAQGCDIELCRIVIGPAFQTKPVTDTKITPEPKYDEVKHLYSDKPLHFKRPVFS